MSDDIWRESVDERSVDNETRDGTEQPKVLLVGITHDESEDSIRQAMGLTEREEYDVLLVEARFTLEGLSPGLRRPTKSA
jgi:hypothetical protein